MEGCATSEAMFVVVFNLRTERSGSSAHEAGGV